MSTSRNQLRSLQLLDRIRRAQMIVEVCVAELRETLVSESAGTQRIDNFLGRIDAIGTRLSRFPIVDLHAMTVVWFGQSCPLGNTKLLYLMDCLVRRSNTYVPVSRLLKEVWHGDCKSEETIRSTVRHLKARLIRAGMADLAAAIRSERHQYGLILPPAGT